MARSKTRNPLAGEVASEVQFGNDLTCCVCRRPDRPTQIHHIDDDPSNGALSNLALLCLDCHNRTQIRGGFARHLTAAVVIKFRDDWLMRTQRRRDSLDRAIIRELAKTYRGSGDTRDDELAAADPNSAETPAEEASPQPDPVEADANFEDEPRPGDQPRYEGPFAADADDSIDLDDEDVLARQFEAIVLAASRNLSSTLALSLTINSQILREAIRAGQSSFRMGPQSPSTLVRLAHLGYWVATLKPISIDPPVSPAQILSTLGRAVEQALIGPGAQASEIGGTYRDAEQRVSRYANYPVSEHIALGVILDLAEVDARRDAQRIADAHLTAKWQADMKRFKEVLYGETFLKVVRGLRYGGNSPATFQLLIESVFSFQPRAIEGDRLS